MSEKPKFCPKCHKRVELPEFFHGVEYKDIKIGCNHCGKGVVEFSKNK